MRFIHIGVGLIIAGLFIAIMALGVGFIAIGLGPLYPAANYVTAALGVGVVLAALGGLSVFVGMLCE